MTLFGQRNHTPVLAALVAVLGLVVMAQSSLAASFTPYTAEAFEQAQSEGKTILVDVHATWCPTCKRQAPILEALIKDPAMEGVVAFRVDWDTDKDFVKTHRIPRQSTILVFQGEKETARSVAETREAELRSLVLGGIGTQ